MSMGSMLMSSLGIDPDEITKFAKELQQTVTNVDNRLKAIQTSQTKMEAQLAELLSRGNSTESPPSNGGLPSPAK